MMAHTDRAISTIAIGFSVDRWNIIKRSYEKNEKIILIAIAFDLFNRKII